LRCAGIRIEEPEEDWQVAVRAESEPDRIAETDLALVCVKLYDTPSAIRQWQPALSRARAIISLQNGLDGIDRLRAAWTGAAPPATFGGLAYVAGQLLGSGHVRIVSPMSSIQYGGPDVQRDAVGREFAGACRTAGFDADCFEDIASAQWSKFAALATNAALTCLTRKPAGVCYHDDELLKLAVRSIDEVIAVGRADGALLPPALAADTLRLLQGLPPQMYASMHHDLEAGKPLELDGLSGHVVRTGLRHRVPTPFHHMAWACLRPWANGKDLS
jgi:2-dehydropantoate 2-reductase